MKMELAIYQYIYIMPKAIESFLKSAYLYDNREMLRFSISRSVVRKLFF